MILTHYDMSFEPEKGVLVFSIAVIAPHEHSTHEHPTKWSTHNPLKPKTTRGGTR